MTILELYEHERSPTSRQDVNDVLKFLRRLSKFFDAGEDTKDDLLLHEKKTETIQHLIAGGVCGAVSRTCTAPLDRLKVFLQVNPCKEKIRICFHQIFDEGGLKGLWRGNGMNVVKIVPESAIKFTTYEKVKRLIKGDSEEELSFCERICAGALAGAFSQTVIYPLDVMKTRLALGKTGQYKGIIRSSFKIYHSEGISSFYRGYVPNILGVIPYAGIEMGLYETLKRKYMTTHSKMEQPSALVSLGCGIIASTLGQICCYPLALVRTRLQAQVAPPSMVRVFKGILRKEGVFGLYRGITPNFIKVLPAAGISYVVYEYTRRSLGAHMT